MADEQEKMKIEHIKMGRRLRNACIRAEIKTLRDMSKLTPSEWMRIKGCAYKTTQEALRILESFGMKPWEAADRTLCNQALLDDGHCCKCRRKIETN